MKHLNFASFFDASPNPYVVMAPNFVIVGANRAYLAITGRNLIDIVDRSMFDAFPTSADEAGQESEMTLRESLERAVRLRVRDELPLIRYGLYRETPEGRVFEERFWSATHTPLLNEAGEVVYVMQHTEDVTELHQLRLRDRVASETNPTPANDNTGIRILQRAQSVHQRNAALLQEAANLRRLFAQAPGFICVVRGPRLVYEMANAAYCTLIGRSDIVGQPAREVSPEAEGQGLFEVIDRVRASGKPELRRDLSVQWHREPGGDGARLVDVIYQPMTEADGTVSGVFIQGIDITEQRRAEIELRRHRDHLEALVVERTEALRRSDEDRLQMQAALQQSQKMEALGKLTGGVAHDFNNALQVISGNLQLLKRMLPSEERIERRLNGAIAGVQRGAKLASHLLAFARKQPLAPVVLSAGRLLRDMDDMLRRALGETIELETIVAGGIWNTLVDPSFLENAMLNLAINARDAMNGSGKLTIEAGNASLDAAYALKHAEVKPGQYVMIAASDTGCGMAPDVVAKVFEPFFTTKAEGHGTGLGLSMVYGFIKQSGGHIKIYSELGHGTTIKIYLPRSFEAEQPNELVPLPTSIGGSETILVVEDDAQVRDTVVDLLSELGYQVLKAGDAQSALAVIESGVPVDLLFTDVVMPGTLRSPELARRAKAIQPQLEVVFTSGYTENAIVHGGRLDPGVALLSKPYTRDELAQKIRHSLSNRRHADQMKEEASRLTEASVPTDLRSSEQASLRILVVEDEADALASTLEILRHLGMRPSGVSSAEAALAQLQAAPFDVLLTDLHLSGMPGSELARSALQSQPRIRVVFASGDRPSGEDVPGATWLSKPFSGDDLRRVLEGAAQRRSSTA